MTKDKIKLLLDKYAQGNCTVDERQLLELWFEQQQVNNEESFSAQDKERVWQHIDAKVNPEQIKTTRMPVYYRWAAAAVLLLCLAMGGYFILQRQALKDSPAVLLANDILPGENKAVLTLSDGRQVMLTPNNGESTRDQGVVITKNKAGLLQYKIDPNLVTGTGYNTIETPRGGQYEVILPDGSKVTLNAESSLRFAVNMQHQHNRVVELKGEGYFDVAKDTRRPFIVKSDQQEIQVLGTVFNVNTYHSSRNLTTLLEGSVLVNKSQKLRPGQQAQVEAGRIVIKDVEVNDFVDWKNNSFIFRNENLASIMERIGRWYNIEYAFKDVDVEKVLFNGEISRYAKVEEVLHLLSVASKLEFEIKNRTIVISNQ